MNPIGAGIVLYNPDIKRLMENIEAVRQQVDFILLVDNASGNIDEIERIFRSYDNLIMIKNKQNLGIAVALNQIVWYCDQKGCDWVLMLDQDSVISAHLLENYAKYLTFERVAVISPKIIDRGVASIEIKNDENEEPEYEYVQQCITSASYIHIKRCQALGLFDESMFIDWVDFEYCMRVLKADYRILRINTAILLHQLGNLKVYEGFGFKIYVTNHSKERVYYYMRNAIYFMKKHHDRVKKNMIYWDIFKKELKVIFFEKQKCRKTFYAMKGVYDGFMNRMGKTI